MAQDFLLDDNGDIKIINGDLVIGESDQQDVEIVFKAHKGEFKEFPILGFGASLYLKKNTNIVEEFIRELELQLEYNGFKDPEIDLSAGFENIKINV